jgi:hypothetical protein
MDYPLSNKDYFMSVRMLQEFDVSASLALHHGNHELMFEASGKPVVDTENLLMAFSWHHQPKGG